MSVLELKNIVKRFSGTDVLRGINLTVEQGEFITLLGSSGCGKTTTLRIIAGLEQPDLGAVILDGVDVTQQPPNRRDVNTVFQSYALFPHMNVETNVGYSLKIRGVDKKEIQQRVAESLALVQLTEFSKRMPSELSGGQRQRVAIARSVIGRPKVLLLDEPLGALDLQLRRQMQFELKRLQKNLGITFIYITHDQEEALNMSDRIAIMREGVFEQLGTPADVYDRPRTAYVAKFVGAANIIQGTAELSGDKITLTNTAGSAEVSKGRFTVQPGDRISVAVRSEQIELLPEGAPGFAGRVKEKNFSGGMVRITVETLHGEEVIASRHGIDSILVPGEAVTVTFAPEHAVLVRNKE